MKFSKMFLVCISAAAVAACGGGGSDAVPDNGLSSIELSPSSYQNVLAGKTLPISAKALFRGSNVVSMAWTIQSLSSASGAPLTISNPSCASVTLVPTTTTGSTSQGFCESIINVPKNAEAGAWRVTGTAIAADGKAKSASIDVAVQTQTGSNFALIEQAVPATGQVGTLVSMNVPFITKEGKTVDGVTYNWQAGSTNPGIVTLSGKTSSTASFRPAAVGQYAFSVTANANVDGVTESATANYVLLVTQKSTDPIAFAGDVSTKVVNTVVKLQGVISNRDTSSFYSGAWTQIAGEQGGPTRLSLSNDQTSAASFVATVPGTYGFLYTVTQVAADGTTKTFTSRTQVIATVATTPLYSIGAGDAQVAAKGDVVNLTGTFDNQSGTSSYQWVQTGGQLVTISNASSAKATFIPTVDGSYTFKFTVETPAASGTTSVSATTQVLVK